MNLMIAMYIDASKDFDRIHYSNLFYILIDNKVLFCIIRLLADSYIRQEARVIWNKRESSYFRISNGVTKGGDHLHYSIDILIGYYVDYRNQDLDVMLVWVHYLMRKIV